MIQLIAGIILFIAPFALLDLFLDKKRGFVYILFFLLLFHTALTFLTQALGIFYYWLVAPAVFLVDLILLIFYFNKKKPILRFPKIDWILVVVAAIACLTLYQVHYNYTGKINIATDKIVSYHEVKNMKYIYPYFSDEWYAVSLVNHSIDSHSLPLKNVLTNSFFPNLEMFFHSFLAGIVMVLGFDHLTQYIVVSMFANILIIILAYVFLRINNISKLASAVVSLSILYITCGATLPGVWHFIPIHMGIIFCLIGFCFLAMGRFNLALLTSLPVIIFYGPLFVFYGLSLAIFALFKFFKDPKDIFKVASYSLIALFLIVPVVYVILMVIPPSGFLGSIVSILYYASSSGFNMPQLNFYNIIPVWIILLVILGLPFASKDKKWIFYTFLLGIIYWIFCSFSVYRFVIEYERAVFFISIITVLISGFGLDWLEKRFKSTKFPVLKSVEIAAFILFLLLVPFYTRINGWERLILIDSRNGSKSYPKSPANNYLVEDDLRIFKDIKEKKFLSIPWKGLVIGVATNNYPLGAKEGTIATGPMVLVDEFVAAGCDGKRIIAEREGLEYVYIDDFDCAGFEKIDKSREGVVLQKVKKN